jgi:hypothetical protein
MATAMLMYWPGVTTEHYEAARAEVGWEHAVPDGAICHIAGFDEGGLRVLDIWDSAEQFQRFAEERLMPVTSKLGIEGEPEIRFYEVHATFNPRLEVTQPAAA